MLHNKDNIKFDDLQKIIEKMGSGAPAAPPQPEKCGSCKAEVKPEWKACPFCGESLDKKRKADDQGGSPKKQKLTPEQLKMREQNEKVFAIRDGLKDNFENVQIKALLDYNDVPSHGGASDVLRVTNTTCVLTVNSFDSLSFLDPFSSYLQRAAECIIFGVLPHCPECGGNLHVENGTYKCTGQSEWARCMYLPLIIRYETDKAETTKFKIPKKPKALASNEWLNDLDLKPIKRILIKEEIKKKEVTAEDILSGAATAAEVGKVDLCSESRIGPTTR